LVELHGFEETDSVKGREAPNKIIERICRAAQKNRGLSKT